MHPIEPLRRRGEGDPWPASDSGGEIKDNTASDFALS